MHTSFAGRLYPIALYRPQQLVDPNAPSSHVTLALAFLQFVHALGVTESGTFLLLLVPLEDPGRTWPDAVDSEHAVLDGEDTDV